MNATQLEQEHFDHLSSERQKNGFIPDLDQMQDCDFFYLSPFRRKALANLALRRSSNFMIGKLTSVLPQGSKVLDLGCGSGWFSLELAKAGFHVTAMDLSAASIGIARKALQTAILKTGSVTYHCADLNTWKIDSPDYAAVCYVGSLHHLEDPKPVVERMKASLRHPHYMVASEPLPHNYGPVEAAIGLLVRGILSASNAWYEKVPLPQTPSETEVLLEEVRSEYENWADKQERRQSPMNNSSDGHDNFVLLQNHYDILETQDILPLLQRLIGGIRLGTDEKNLALAKFLVQIEEVLHANAVIKPGGFNAFGISRA